MWRPDTIKNGAKPKSHTSRAFNSITMSNPFTSVSISKSGFLLFTAFIILGVSIASAQETGMDRENQQIFIDVHELGAGVTFADVAKAHEADLQVQDKYGVNFLSYWVDETEGKVYCRATAKSPDDISQAHHEAHGLIPDRIYAVSEGVEEPHSDEGHLFLDIHELGAGNVTPKAVEEAHKKDLELQDKYGVNFVNYWVDEKEGVVMCLTQAPDSSAVINTHKEAHGLIPTSIQEVFQGY